MIENLTDLRLANLDRGGPPRANSTWSLRIGRKVASRGPLVELYKSLSIDTSGDARPSPSPSPTRGVADVVSSSGLAPSGSLALPPPSSPAEEPEATRTTGGSTPPAQGSHAVPRGSATGGIRRHVTPLVLPRWLVTRQQSSSVKVEEEEISYCNELLEYIRIGLNYNLRPRVDL